MSGEPSRRHIRAGRVRRRARARTDDASTPAASAATPISSDEQHEPRNDGWKRCGREQGVEPAAECRAEGGSSRIETDQVSSRPATPINTASPSSASGTANTAAATIRDHPAMRSGSAPPIEALR